MSKYVENFASKLDWAMPFQRTGGFPLDRTNLFDSYDDAVLYATKGADSRGLSGTSYVGQIIVVYENDSVSAYIITANRSLSKLASTTASGDLAGDVVTLQTKVSDLTETVDQLSQTLLELDDAYKAADVETLNNAKEYTDNVVSWGSF